MTDSQISYYVMKTLIRLAKQEILFNAILRINQVMIFRLSASAKGRSNNQWPMVQDYKQAMKFALEPVEAAVLQRLKLRVGEMGFLGLNVAHTSNARTVFKKG